MNEALGNLRCFYGTTCKLIVTWKNLWKLFAIGNMALLTGYEPWAKMKEGKG